MKGHISDCFVALLGNEGDSDISRSEKGTNFKNKGENKNHKYDYIYKLITFTNLIYICE